MEDSCKLDNRGRARITWAAVSAKNQKIISRVYIGCCYMVGLLCIVFAKHWNEWIQECPWVAHGGDSLRSCCGPQSDISLVDCFPQIMCKNWHFSWTGHWTFTAGEKIFELSLNINFVWGACIGQSFHSSMEPHHARGFSPSYCLVL